MAWLRFRTLVSRTSLRSGLQTSKSKSVMWHTSVMTGKAKRPPARRQRAADSIRQDVATYVAAGADESVQRVITSVHGLSRRLNQWYDRQLADLDVSTGEWAVLSKLARDGGEKGLTLSVLADAAGVAPSSMTHRLDRM